MTTEYQEQLVTNLIGRHYWIYKDDSFYQQRIAKAGPYQKQNLVRLRQLVPAARTVLDVGMNIGMNTIEYATWAQEVHGFEPTPQTYNMALKNIALAQAQCDTDLKRGWYPIGPTRRDWASCKTNAKIYAHNFGLGDVESQFEMLIKKNNAGHNHIDNIHVPLPSGKSRRRSVEPEKVTVDVHTIDNLNYTAVDIIKVDTEGYEFPVVRGAEKTILRDLPVVQLEMVEGQPERFGHTCQEIYDWFLCRDFIITLSDGTDAGQVWSHFPKKMERFFIHKSKV